MRWHEDGHDDSDVTAERVYRNGQFVATVKIGALHYLDQAVQPGQVYSYTVEAIDIVGQHSKPEGPVVVRALREGKSAPPLVARAPVPAAPSSPFVHPAAVSTQLRRYPYLTDVVGPNAIINWATDSSSAVGTVKWGRVGAEACTANSAPATKTNVSVNSLTEYLWRAALTLRRTPSTAIASTRTGWTCSARNPSPHFWTQIPAGAVTALSFAVFGDWGVGG